MCQNRTIWEYWLDLPVKSIAKISFFLNFYLKVIYFKLHKLCTINLHQNCFDEALVDIKLHLLELLLIWLFECKGNSSVMY